MNNNINDEYFYSCYKCLQKASPTRVLMRTFTAPSGYCSCDHIFCIDCFTIKNSNATVSSILCCPRCNLEFLKNTSKEEAALIGEGMYLFSRTLSCALTEMEKYMDYIACIDRFERALTLNPFSIISLTLAIRCYDKAASFYSDRTSNVRITAGVVGIVEIETVEIYKEHLTKLHDRCIELFSISFDSNNESIVADLDVYYYLLGLTFNAIGNCYQTVKYYELAYAFALKTKNEDNCQQFEDVLGPAKARLGQQLKLRYKVGDEVEVSNDNGEWQRGTVVELYYREKSYPLDYNAPYRILISAASDSTLDVYTCAQADTDRYVRKVGAKAIENTRYQSKLDAKVDELAYVYCSQAFIQEIYGELQLDQGFCQRLLQIGRIKVTLTVLYTYRMLVMYSQPLVRTDAGYHIPTLREVVSGFKAYLAPCVQAGYVCTPIGCSAPTIAEADYTVLQNLNYFFRERALLSAHETYPA